jgi:hypothetical protein
LFCVVWFLVVFWVYSILYDILTFFFFFWSAMMRSFQWNAACITNHDHFLQDSLSCSCCFSSLLVIVVGFPNCNFRSHLRSLVTEVAWDDLAVLGARLPRSGGRAG